MCVKVLLYSRIDYIMVEHRLLDLVTNKYRSNYAVRPLPFDNENYGTRSTKTSLHMATEQRINTG